MNTTSCPYTGKSVSLRIRLLSFCMVVTMILLSRFAKFAFSPAVLAEPFTLSGEKRLYSFIVW